MDKVDLDILERIESLHPFVGEDWDNGPYSADEIREGEKRLGRSLDAHHRCMLERYGGKFTFELGSVDVAGTDKDVDVFFGLGNDIPYSIASLWHGYRGQIPEKWYPIALDSLGHFYCLTDRGAVHYIELKEDLWTRDRRPETAGYRVADSFVDFVMSLQLPDWAQAYFDEQEPGTQQ